MIALYLRLSMSDGDLGSDGKDESNSIENQREMLRTYVKKKKDLKGKIVEYVDDGYSGTNFDRPEFKRMLEDMKKGEIDVLLTKDLSRLGWNYIEVGDYIEQVFPILGIRYIAVNSNYDSNDYIGTTVGLEMSVMNLVNTLYSKDLSRKFKTSVEAQWKRGRSTSGRPPLGYMRDPEDKTQWIIEPVAARIVRRVFDLALEAKMPREIAEILNEERVMTPGKYRELYGYVKNVSRKVPDSEWLWDYVKVYHILKTYEYTGALVQSKRTRVVIGSSRTTTVPENDRIVFEGHHEPIVTKEEFKLAGETIKRIKKSGRVNSDDYPLRGHVYCGNCGNRMEHRSETGGFLMCRHKARTGSKSKCSDCRIPTSRLDYLVRRALNEEIDLLGKTAGYIKEYSDSLSESKDMSKVLDREIRVNKREKARLYEEYADGRISKDEYISRRDDMQKIIDRLEENIKSVSADAEKAKHFEEESKKYMNKAKKIYKASELTTEIVEAFIDRIDIYDEDHMEIRYKFSDLIRTVSELKEGGDYYDDSSEKNDSAASVYSGQLPESRDQYPA